MSKKTENTLRKKMNRSLCSNLICTIIIIIYIRPSTLLSQKRKFQQVKRNFWYPQSAAFIRQLKKVMQTKAASANQLLHAWRTPCPSIHRRRSLKYLSLIKYNINKKERILCLTTSLKNSVTYLVSRLSEWKKKSKHNLPILRRSFAKKCMKFFWIQKLTSRKFFYLEI